VSSGFYRFEIAVGSSFSESVFRDDVTQR